MRHTRALAGAAIAALALVPATVTRAGEAAPVKRTVTIGDNFFAPDALRVPRNSVVTWRWPSVPGDLHDVYLRRGPKGVKRFHSAYAASDIRFRRRLEKPGRYLVVCTLHEQQMRMTVRVRR